MPRRGSDPTPDAHRGLDARQPTRDRRLRRAETRGSVNSGVSRSTEICPSAQLLTNVLPAEIVTRATQWHRLRIRPPGTAPCRSQRAPSRRCEGSRLACPGCCSPYPSLELVRLAATCRTGASQPSRGSYRDRHPDRRPCGSPCTTLPPRDPARQRSRSPLARLNASRWPALSWPRSRPSPRGTSVLRVRRRAGEPAGVLPCRPGNRANYQALLLYMWGEPCGIGVRG